MEHACQSYTDPAQDIYYHSIRPLFIWTTIIVFANLFIKDHLINITIILKSQTFHLYLFTVCTMTSFPYKSSGSFQVRKLSTNEANEIYSSFWNYLSFSLFFIYFPKPLETVHI